MNTDKNPLSIVYAIPDHPWVDTVDGAAVRIAMTVGEMDGSVGFLYLVASESELSEGDHSVQLDLREGKIVPNLKLGANLVATSPLRGNENISNRGFCLFGKGFIVDPERALDLHAKGGHASKTLIHDYRNGKDLTDKPRGVKVIDAFECNLNELKIEIILRFINIYLQQLSQNGITIRENREEKIGGFLENQINSFVFNCLALTVTSRQSKPANIGSLFF